VGTAIRSAVDSGAGQVEPKATAPGKLDRADGKNDMMLRKPIGQRLKVELGILSMLGLVVGYNALSDYQHERNPEDSTVPNWEQMQKGIIRATTVEKTTLSRWKEARQHDASLERPQSWLVTDLKATGTRLFLGLLIGSVGALLLGLLMGCFKTCEAILLPPTAFLAKIPPTAALAVFFILVGTDLEMFVTMIAFGIMPVMGQSIYLATRDVSENLLNKAYTLGATSCEVICHVIVPSILPRLLDALRLAIGPSVVYLIAAEMVCSDVGFGYRIRLQARLLNMNVVYPYIVLLAMFGFGMDFGLKRLQRAWCPWYNIEDSN